MKGKNPKSDIYFGNHFLLLLIGLFFSLAAVQAAADKFEGSFSITIPGDRLLKSIKLGVDLPQNRDMIVNQNQAYGQADSMIQVGNLSRIIFKKSYKGKLRYKDSEQSSIQAIFYLYDNVDLLKTFSIEPKFYSKDNEFHSKGITDKVFTLEFLEVDRVGEANGKSLKKIESLAFNIGKKNNFNLNLRPQNGKKIAVKLSTQNTGQHFLHFPVKKRGKYPFDLNNLQGGLIKRVYAAPINFSYVLSKARNADRSNDLNFRQLTREVNNFVKSHPDYGKSRVIEVPISLQMNLMNSNEPQELKAVVGPPRKKSSKKRRRNFLGF